MDGGDRPGHTGTTTESDPEGDGHLEEGSSHGFDAPGEGDQPDSFTDFDSETPEDAYLQDGYDDEPWVEAVDDDTYWGAPPPLRSGNPETMGLPRPAGRPAHRSPSRPAGATLPSSPGPTYRLNRRGKIVFTAIPVAVVVLIGLAAGGGEPFLLEGFDDGTVINAEQAGAASLRVVFADPPDPERVSAMLGDVEIPVTFDADGVTAQVAMGSVPEGEHTVTVALDSALPLGGASLSRTFTVDATAPSLEMVGPNEAVRVSVPVTLRLAVDDPQATVSIGGQTLTVVDGVAELEYERPPRAPIEVTATDAAGNAAVMAMTIPVALPGEPGQEPMRGVHASGWTWATPELKDPIMEMIAEGRINTVQLDLKDEAGDIWYDTSVELAHEMNAVTELWDLEETVAELHALDVRVVGRIVNFRDNKLVDYAIESGNMDWIVQTPEGGVYGKYGGFANPFSRDVWEYNIALAEEAALLGVDDILYDYVRRPDDFLDNMRFPLQDGDPSIAVNGFLDESRQRIHAAGARLGASVFGIAATRPDEVAQDIPEMARHVDYIAPMVYPSHWGPGEYGVADPNSQPYDIVYESMADFVRILEGTGTGLVSWLQDFSLGVDYGPAEVRAQIDASVAAGVPDFLLWDAATTYTEEALD
ncbi:MAG: putative glycoside hydrolase [Acidimicrobiia bacterium]